MEIKFAQAYEQFMEAQILGEVNARRRERLEKGLGHAEQQFLKDIWYPAVGHFRHLHAEWEIVDLGNQYRYLDFAYMPAGCKGAIEIQGYSSHARDIEIRRFKDLCMKQSHLGLDGWIVLPIAYPSIVDSPRLCQQLVLALVGRFVSLPTVEGLTWMEQETIRFARGRILPFLPADLADHLCVSVRYARELLRGLVKQKLLKVTSGTERKRTYQYLY